VDAGFSTLPAAVPFVRNGKLRALMVTDAKRSPAAPDIPAATEAGLADMVLITWNGVLAPAATPPAVLDRLNKDVVTVMNTPDMKERMLMHAAEVRTNSRDAFTQFIREDFAKWTKLVKASGARSSGG